MINVAYGDVLSVPSGIIVHGCNAQGVMGAGVARQVKERFPAAYASYIAQMEAGWMEVGNLSHVVIGNVIIVNAITQHFYGRVQGRRYVSYDGVADCFEKVKALARVYKQTDVHFPAIGAGLGGGRWEAIAAIIDDVLGDAINKTLWLPKGD